MSSMDWHMLSEAKTHPNSDLEPRSIAVINESNSIVVMGRRGTPFVATACATSILRRRLPLKEGIVFLSLRFRSISASSIVQQ